MNPIAGIRDTGISHAFRNAVGWKGKWNRWFLNGAVHGEWETAGGRSYPGGRISRARFRVQQQVSCELGKGFGLLLSIRQEITGTQASPFMPGLELSRRGYKGKLSYISRINVYRKFRAPSLNDLYWSGAGNPDLKSESAWSTEAVFGMQFGRAFDFQIRGYWMRVNNWILWTPQQGGNWQPRNEWLVLSRGAEADIRWNVLHALVSRKWKLEINMSYAFNKADVKDAGGLTPLMYAPRHRLIAGMLLGWEGLWLRSWINVMSLRYTDRAGRESLPAVLIPHLEAGYLYTKGHFQIGGFFRCSNPGNTFYQEVVMRPMPGRMLEGGITFGYR
jgi:iron complex outermembrane receptor protein